MKIYEKPSIEIKKFEVEDIITVSGEVDYDMGAITSGGDVEALTGDASAQGIVYEW